MAQTIDQADLPAHLRGLDSPPKQLFVRGNDDETFSRLMRRRRIAVVGTRKVSAYGQEVTHQLVSKLAARGIVIVSGLAFGIDAIAHKAALEVDGLTMAVLPSPLEAIHPRSNINLAQKILDNNGALVSEYPEGYPVYKTNFVARNRIVTGLSDALLIVEAAENSGTMHTARFALDQGIEVLVVPGNITSPTSAGTNNLLKSGATPVTAAADILHTLSLPFVASDNDLPPERIRGANPNEQRILDLLEQGINQGSKLLLHSGLRIEEFNHHLTMLEITAKIRPLGANNWGLS